MGTGACKKEPESESSTKLDLLLYDYQNEEIQKLKKQIDTLIQSQTFLSELQNEESIQSIEKKLKLLDLSQSNSDTKDIEERLFLLEQRVLSLEGKELQRKHEEDYNRRF